MLRAFPSTQAYLDVMAFRHDNVLLREQVLDTVRRDDILHLQAVGWREAAAGGLPNEFR